MTSPIRANLVVTMVDRPTSNDVDAYLSDVLQRLNTELKDAELVEVWTIAQPEAASDVLQQRFIVRHTVSEVAVEMIQQHTWIDDTIVVVTATVPVDLPNDMARVVSDCLDSVGLAA